MVQEGVLKMLDEVRCRIDKKAWEKRKGCPEKPTCPYYGSAKCKRTYYLFSTAVRYDARQIASPDDHPVCLGKRQKDLLKNSNKMKILHCGTGTSGQAVLREQQRKDGHIADVFVHTMTNKKQGFDINLSMSPYEFGVMHNAFSIARNIFNGNFRDLLRYDLYHIYHDAFLFPSRKDIWWLKKYLKKKVLLDWRGQGVRVWGFHTLPWFKGIKQTCATPDLLEYQVYEGQFEWVPICVDAKKLMRIKTETHDNMPTIIHAPSNRKTKGTPDVLKAISQLKKEGYKFNFILNENLPWEKTIENYAKSDICVGWMDPAFGIYAKIEIENMALGKTVVASVKPEYIEKYYKGCPIVPATPKDLVKQLRWIIGDSSFRKQNIKKGRDYVMRMHDVVPVSKRFYRIYEEC